MTSTDDDDSVVSLSNRSDVDDAGNEVESKVDSFGDADNDKAEESAVANEEHADTDDDISDGANEHVDVIGDDDDDHHSDVVEEAEEPMMRRVVSMKRNLMTAMKVHPKIMMMK